jgi:pimeloyl-[acyl-carrier protein] methyl ester esterase
MAAKVRRNIDRALEGFITRMFASGETKSEVVDRLLSSVQVPATAVALQALEALVEADMRDCLARIACPTLIIHGELDVICLPQASEYLSMHIRNAREVVLSGCGHIPFLTQSSKFNASIEGFRDKLRGGVYQQE